MSADNDVERDNLLHLCQLSDDLGNALHYKIKKHLMPLMNDPVMTLLAHKKHNSGEHEDLLQMFDNLKANDTAEVRLGFQWSFNCKTSTGSLCLLTACQARAIALVSVNSCV